MKLSSASLVLFSATSSAATGVLETFLGFTTNRGLADMCLSETTDLFVDSELPAAFEAVNDEIDDKASCVVKRPIGESNANAYCLVDFDTFDTTSEFTDLCDMDGGKNVKVSAVIDCFYKSGGPVLPFQRRMSSDMNGFTLSYYNLFDCVSDTCSNGEVMNKISSTLMDTAEMLGEKFNADCSSFISFDADGEDLFTSDGDTASCLSETTDLFVDSELPAAFEAVNDEIDDKASCVVKRPIGESNANAYCLVDFDTFDTTSEFTDLCDMDGGKNVKVSAVIDCFYKSGGPVLPFQRRMSSDMNGFTLSYYNLFDCVSDTCSNGEVMNKISSTLMDTAEMLGEKLNADCASFISSAADSDSEDLFTSDGGSASITDTENEGSTSSSTPEVEETGTSSSAPEVEDTATSSGTSEVEETAKEIVDIDEVSSAFGVRIAIMQFIQLTMITAWLFL